MGPWRQLLEEMRVRGDSCGSGTAGFPSPSPLPLGHSQKASLTRAGRLEQGAPGCYSPEPCSQVSEPLSVAVWKMVE